jgi:hypothetical protein
MESRAITTRKMKPGGKTAFRVAVFVFRWRGRGEVRRGITRSQPPRGAATSNATPLALPSTIARLGAYSAQERRFDCQPGKKAARTIPHRFRPKMITAQIPHKTWFSHIPAQVFLPIIAPRCNKTLAIRGKMSYQYKQLTAQKCKERQQ